MICYWNGNRYMPTDYKDNRCAGYLFDLPGCTRFPARVDLDPMEISQ
jgi:hypothetical protein